MTIQITTTRAAAMQNGVKCAIYGKSGMGKTKLCATAPAPIIISAESGLLTLRNYDVPVIEVKTFQQLVEAQRFLSGSAEGMQYQTVCLDSATEIAEQVLSNAKIVSKDPRQAYGQLSEDMVVLLKAFRDLPGRNVVLVAKQGTTKDGVTGGLTFGPSFPGQQLPQAFPYLFDEVFHIGMMKLADGNGQMQDVRVMRTKPDAQYDAKDRSGLLPPIIQVPEMPDGTNTHFLSWIFQTIMQQPQPV